MNASGRLNTCKSRGSIMESNIYGGDPHYFTINAN